MVRTGRPPSELACLPRGAGLRLAARAIGLAQIRKEPDPWPSPKSKRAPAAIPFGSSDSWRSWPSDTPPRRLGRGSGHEPQDPGDGPGPRGREPSRQVALGDGRTGRRARALPDRARPGSDEPNRRAQHRAPASPHDRGRRQDRRARQGREGACRDLRRRDRQDRLRDADGPGVAATPGPRQPGRRGRTDPRGQPTVRRGQRHSASASSSRASQPACSSSSPTATSTRPGSPRSATATSASSSARSSRTRATTAR